MAIVAYFEPGPVAKNDKWKVEKTNGQKDQLGYSCRGCGRVERTLLIGPVGCSEKKKGEKPKLLPFRLTTD
jgi:hypothetical protein